ncbi:MAG: 4-(cytidine 5'-diphospho)-2-C-methyl-D-erythritol kinase [Elusimicrobiales bacterium]|jgi:4-diphosphocytidyl-2-C-methyl-D-erythritol kinase|nr:4-(cytidine 5'-diphospho)-2-C-methyl-D-erythritol kinase [Elusimicrobiales bacterium]NLH39777.1 4-(cytidine 5'-diphospho)-2-C-methyl-D-erythritol kinase [Elusimicrobiota bacterium]
MITDEYKAFAKVNLFLEILGRRDDGYHNIKSLFARVDIYDSLKISINEKSLGISLEVINKSNAFNIANTNNLVYRAADMFMREFDIKSGVSITLTKNIPLGAGLGGGSSDCGMTLAALSDIFKIKDYKRVFDIGASLGSDVPFFLKNTSFACCEGRGEIVTPLDIKAFLPSVLVVFPSVSISTKEVYQSMDHQYTPKTDLFDMFVSELMEEKMVDFSRYLFNRLEATTFNISKEVGQLKELLLSEGLFSLMSGSGSSIFAISYDYQKLKKIYEKLLKSFDFVFLTKFV